MPDTGPASGPAPDLAPASGPAPASDRASGPASGPAPHRRYPLESEAGVRFWGDTSIEDRVVALAIEQGGVFELGQAIEIGFTARAVQLRAATARWHRVRRGVYSILPIALLGPKGHLHAAILACGPGAALSHRTAAHRHGIRHSASARIDVVVPGRTRQRQKGIVVHTSITLEPQDIVLVHGIPTTTLARTFLDLADVLTGDQVERAFEQAEQLEQLDYNALRDQIARNRTRPAAAKLQTMMDRYTSGHGIPWSEIERAVKTGLTAAGLPLPEINSFIDPGDGEPPIRPDFHWREHRVVLQTDGWETHRTRAAFERDRRNDQRLTRIGIDCARATGRQILNEWPRIEELIALMLSARGAAAAGQASAASTSSSVRRCT